MQLKHSIAIGLGLALCGLAAQAAETRTDQTESQCRETGHFVPPQIPWMGDFAYKVSVTAKDGRPDDVSIKTLRGPDRTSDRVVTDALREYIRKNYVCEGVDQTSELTLMLHFKHEMPQALLEKQIASRAAQAASALAATASAPSTAAAADVPGAGPTPARAGMVCTVMGKPDVPRVNGTGELSLHAIAGVTEGRVTVVDIKLKTGSREPSVNQVFIDSVTRVMQDTYRCPGDHIFTQEFRFKIS